MAGWYKLTRKGASFNLNDGTLCKVLESFTPPGQGNGWATTIPLEFTGASAAEVQEGMRRMKRFINSGTKFDPVYLEYAASMPIPYKPVWGQAVRRYKLASCLVGSGDDVTAYGMGHRMRVEVGVTSEPWAEGQKQKALKSLGGIIEDTLGSEDGLPRGTIVAPATTNLFTNPLPVNATGWTFGADLSTWYNQEREYILYGDFSLGVMRTAGVNINATMSLTATNTNTWVISALFKRFDGAAVTDGLVKMFYDASALTTTFVEMADGWYLGYATVTGVASAKATGIQVQAEDITFYATGFMFHEASYPAPFCYGNMVGCTWGGTMHASSTTRAAGQMQGVAGDLFDSLQWTGKNYIDQGTIRVALRWWYPSTYGTDQYIFSSGGIVAYYKASDSKIYFADGTNTISTAAQTFAAGDLVVLHFVWGPGSMKIYKNGVEAATGAAFAPFSKTALLYPGGDSSQCAATLLDFTIWNEMATAAQALADYSEVNEQTGSGDGFGQRLNAIPWRWARSASPIDMYQDSTHLDALICGGIPGDTPAQTRWELSNSATGNRSLLLALNTSPVPYNLREEFIDLSGTVVAGALGGEVERASVNTTEVAIPGTTQLNISYDKAAYYGKPCYLFGVIADAGSTLTARLKLLVSSAYILYGDYKAIGADGTRRQFLIGPITIPEGADLEYNYLGASTVLDFYIGFVRTTAGAANVDLDWLRLLVGKVAYCAVNHADSKQFYIQDGRCQAMTYGAGSQTEECLYQGDVLDLEPSAYNYITLLSGDLGAAVTNTETTQLNCWVTPRWEAE